MKNYKIFAPFIVSFFFIGCQDKDNQLSPMLSSEIQNSLNIAINDEYKAATVYKKNLTDFGENTKPFSNIINAENKHSEALKKVMQTYNINVPTNTFKVEQMPSFSSIAEACKGGEMAEIENIEMYDDFLKMELPADVKQVFENNRAASLNNHLPAFRNCK